MATVIPDDIQNAPVVALLTRKNPHMLPVIPAGVPWAARPAGPAGLREDDRAQPRLLLHIACQAGGQIAALPTRYLCGAPVSLLLGRIAPGTGPDGPGVCPICAALDHPGRLPGRENMCAVSDAVVISYADTCAAACAPSGNRNAVSGAGAANFLMAGGPRGDR
jgi:hypothetical protein